VASVYIVTAGSYSDYHIITAFSTPEMAERFVAEYNGQHGSYYGEKAEAEEYTLDSPPPEWKYADVFLDEGGNVTEIRWRISTAGAPAAPYFTWPFRAAEPTLLCVQVQTEEEERAVKVAHEKWAAIKAAVLWGDHEAVSRLTGGNNA